MGKLILKGAESYLDLKSDKGILFLHGFTGSPHEHRWVAKKFSQMGYSVSVPLLAGHGTKASDLKKTKWQDWYESAKLALVELKKHTSEVVVVGLSMGGVLALHLAAHYQIKGVAALATPFFLNDWKLKFLPYIKHIIKYKPKFNGADIKNPKEKLKAVHYKYQPLESIEQLLSLFDHVKNDLPDVHIPTLLIYSTKDHVAPFENKNFVKNRISSTTVNELVLNNCYHILTLDEERDKVFTTLNNFIEKLLGSTKKE